MSTSKQSTDLPDDEALRGFLLSRLKEIDQKNFEEKLMTDDRVHDRLRLAELQLADDFAADKLDQFDRERLSKTFAVTDDRRRMLAVSAALHRRFSRLHSLVPINARTSWRGVFNRPVARFAFGAIILALLIGSLWLVTKEPNVVRRIMPKRVPSRPIAIPTPQQANHPANVAPPVHRDDADSPDGHESSSPNQSADSRVVATVELSSGPLTDPAQAPTINLPDGGGGFVRLELAVEAASAEFQAEVLTQGKVVFASNSLRPSGNVRVEVDIPVQTLNAGDYEVKLSHAGDTSKQAVANYYFKVR